MLHTATTIPTDVTAPPALAPIRPLRFSTLVAVEMRKMTDTRSGRLLLAGILGLATVAVGWKLTQGDTAVSFRRYGGVVLTIVTLFAPILGLLAMTSEWTQRTALTTFTLAPRRLQVIGAKYVAVILISLAVFATGVVLTLVGMAVGGAVHGGADYAGILTDIRSYAILVPLQVTMAVAIGALTAHTGVALVAYLLAPSAFAVLSEEVLKGASPWFDIFTAYENLSESNPFHHFGQSLTAVAIWIVLPSVLGVASMLRREVK